jgi:unsaturated chondroitin disaccharide hydrolase
LNEIWQSALNFSIRKIRNSLDESLFENAITAAETFTQRYNSRGEYLLAWGDKIGDILGTPYQRGKINIDLMMNLSLLFWASSRTGDLKYARIAARHARTSRFALVRPDGSTAQVADFNPDTGAFLLGLRQSRNP